METATILQKMRRSGDVNAETTVRIFPLDEGFLVEQRTRTLRFRDGVLLGSNVASWHLDDEGERSVLVSGLEMRGFEVTERPPTILQLVQTFLGWST